MKPIKPIIYQAFNYFYRQQYQLNGYQSRLSSQQKLPFKYLPRYNYSSSQAVFQMKQLQELMSNNSTNKFDSEILYDQFKSNVSKIENSEVINQFCKYFIKQFESRIENEKAIKICDYAIDLNKNRFKNSSPTSLMYFKGQKIILKYEQGELNEMKKLADELYAFYLLSKEVLDSTVKIKYQIYLAETMARVNLIEYAEMYLSGTIDALQNDEKLELSKEEIYEIYYIHFGCYLLQKKYELAIQYGFIAYQIMKDKAKSKPSFILLGLYNCYKSLNNFIGQQQVLIELLKYPQDGLTVDNINKLVFFPFRKRQNQIIDYPLNTEVQQNTENSSKYTQNLQSQFLINQSKGNQSLDWLSLNKVINQKSDYNSDSIWNEKQDKGMQYIQQNKIEEGIKYYLEILSKLDNSKDQEKMIYINDRIAFMYSQIGEIDKAIQISLDSHKKILVLRNNILQKDKLTLQNLLYLKYFYYINQDLQKTIEWGKKWHAYCLKYNYFDYDDLFIIENLIYQATALIATQQWEEALDYCKFIQEILEKFNNQEMLRTIHGLYITIYSELKKIPEVLQSASIVIDYYQKNLNNLSLKEKQVITQFVKKCIYFALELQDYDSILKYGKIYLQLRKSDEGEDGNYEFRIRLYYEMSQGFIEKKQYKDGEQILKQALQLIKKYPQQIEMEFKIYISLSQVLQQQKKFDEAENYIILAQNNVDTYFKADQNQQLEKQQQIYLNQSIIFFNKNNFNSSIQYIEKYYKLNDQPKPKISQKIVEILKILYNKKEYKIQVKNLIKQYNISFDK